MPSRIFLRSRAVAAARSPARSSPRRSRSRSSRARASRRPMTRRTRPSTAATSRRPSPRTVASRTARSRTAHVPDAGAPPLDFECPTDPWTKATKPKKECEPRQVKVVEAAAPIDVRGISIARTPTGRVGIVYNSEQGAETGEIHLVHFVPTLPTYPAPKLVTRATGFAFHDGYNTKIAAMAPDTLAGPLVRHGRCELRRRGPSPQARRRHGAAHRRARRDRREEPDRDRVRQRSRRQYRRDVPRVDGRDDREARRRRRRHAGGRRSRRCPIWRRRSTPRTRPASAPASMFVDPGGQVHLLYHYNDDALAPQFSTPRYHTLAGATWSDRKTIDNNAPDGLSGFSASLAVFGTKKYAAFFFRKARASRRQRPRTCCSSSWDCAPRHADDRDPRLSRSRRRTRSTPRTASRSRSTSSASCTSRSSGRRTSTHKNGYLEYRRQTREPGGGTKWLSDIVDPDVFSDLSSAFVDMVVDENARPHIAYRSGEGRHRAVRDPLRSLASLSSRRKLRRKNGGLRHVKYVSHLRMRTSRTLSILLASAMVGLAALAMGGCAADATRLPATTSARPKARSARARSPRASRPGASTRRACSCSSTIAR